VFSVLSLVLVVASRSPRPLTRAVFPVLVAISLTAILFSGERKAYILLALTSPFLLNFRNPLTYIVPLVLVCAIPVLIDLDKSGYVERQLGTLVGFAHGEVVQTRSNEGRAEAVWAAKRTFEQHPTFGVGTNAVAGMVNRLDPTIPAPHNEWLRVAAENGVVGLFLYALSVFWGVAGLFRSQVLGRRRSRSEKAIAAVFVFMLLLYVSFEAFDHIVTLAFMLIPFVQYLRLDPADGWAPRRLAPSPQARRIWPREAEASA
jgi:O-antigen ligase